MSANKGAADGSPSLYFSFGVTKTGSTLAYRMARHFLECRGHSQALLPAKLRRPGHDDMAAILLAAWHPSVQLEAITTVCGNAPLTHTTNNALRIVDAFGLDVPVYAGAELPLLHRYEFPAAFHGPSGLAIFGVGGG